MELTVEQLAKRLNAKLLGDGTQPVNSVGPVESAGSDTVVFVNSDKQLKILESFLENSKAGAILVNKHIDTKTCSIPQLIVKDVNSALIEMLNIFAPQLKPAPKGIAPTATIAENAQIAENASIGANVIIEDGVRIGQNTIIAAGCKIGQNCKIGSNSQLDCNIAIYHNCTIGNNVIIQANTTIGSLGFGYYFINGSHKLIPHNGGVIIEDFVEIGANCCIDRAKFSNTVIGAGTKIDNLVHIAHNVITGKCCLIAGQAGIAGSTRIGDGVVLAGMSGINDNVKIGDGVMIGACSGVFHDVPDGQKMFGSPATKLSDALKTVSASRRLPDMLKQLKQLTKRVESLETAKNNKK